MIWATSMKRLAYLLILGILPLSIAFADFSYEQTTRFSGGAMMSVMRMAGAFSKELREPTRSTVIVKGSRMAHIDARRTQLIDLDTETITSIDNEKKTYSVMTFAEMRQMMEEMAARMKGKNKEGQQAQFSIDVKDTGRAREIAGLKAKELQLTIRMETEDPKSGQNGAMDILSEMWMAPDIPGYQEVKAFQTKMAEKLAWSPGLSFVSMMQPEAGRGMAEAAKQMSKMDGVPVLTVTRVGSGGQPVPDLDAAAGQAAQQQQGQNEAPSASDVLTSTITGGLPGLGRLGGFGRKKKQPQQQPAPQQQPQQQSQRAAPPDSILELTTETSGFSSAPADISRLEVPSGYKQVESDFAKRHH